MITVRDFVVNLGIPFDKWMLDAVEEANLQGVSDIHSTEISDIISKVKALPKFNRVKLRDNPLPYYMNLDNPQESIYTESGDIDYLQDNYNNVKVVMDNIMRIPTVVSGAIMPDACPAGTISVGSVVGTHNAIHPAFHSADICCSVMLSEFSNGNPKDILEAAHKLTHFGPTKRDDPVEMTSWLVERVLSNSLTRPLLESANRDFATQGDGNHFLSVGTSKEKGKVCLVTHHGSRSFGAKLYKAGMRIASRFAKDIAPIEVCNNTALTEGYHAGNLAWIPYDTPEGKEYWEALGIVKDWTKANHKAIHTMVQEYLELDIVRNFWNEHNFVFKKGDTFYHAKGATPSQSLGYDYTLVPLNMAEPILITKGTGVENGIGFLPHGAGRNMSRKEFNRKYPNPKVPEGITLISYTGTLDTTELPQAYKSAEEVKYQMINKYKLAEVSDEVIPYGTIMAGKVRHSK